MWIGYYLVHYQSPVTLLFPYSCNTPGPTSYIVFHGIHHAPEIVWAKYHTAIQHGMLMPRISIINTPKNFPSRTDWCYRISAYHLERYGSSGSPGFNFSSNWDANSFPSKEERTYSRACFRSSRVAAEAFM